LNLGHKLAIEHNYYCYYYYIERQGDSRNGTGSHGFGLLLADRQIGSFAATKLRPWHPTKEKQSRLECRCKHTSNRSKLTKAKAREAKARQESRKVACRGARAPQRE
jgi:hypothetical protein